MQLMQKAMDEQVKMAEEGRLDELPKFSFSEFFRILTSPDIATELKFFVGKQLVVAEPMLRNLEGDTVILGGRNEVVLEKLEEALEGGASKIAIFYGGAHMPGIETTMLNEMGFKKKGEEWLNAWQLERPALRKS